MSDAAAQTTRRSARALAVAALVAWGLGVGGAPLLVGPPGGDDAYYHAMYAQQHARCWRQGTAFPRWYPDLNGGLGGPEPRARPVLPLALHAALAAALDDAVATTSLVTLVLPVVAGLAMRVAARRRGAGTWTATLAGAAWSAAPYLLISVHERAALQECWALALLPWALESLLPPKPFGGREIARGAVGFAALLAAQLLVAYMAAAVVAVAHAVSWDRRLREVSAAGMLGAGLAAFSWVPNLASLRRLQGEVFAEGWFDWRGRFLFAADASAPELARHMLLAFAGVCVAALLLAVARRSGGRTLAAVGLAAAALATPLARPLYEVVPGFGMLQFPWRWLGVATSLVVLAAASCLPARRSVLALALVVAPLAGADLFSARLPSGPPLRPSETPEKTWAAATRFGVPPVLPSFPAALPRGVDLRAALGAASAARHALPQPTASGPNLWEWRVSRSSEGPFLLPLLADDGWRTGVDGGEVPWRDRDGLVEVVVPAGTHRVVARQVWLVEDWTAAAVSILVLLGAVAWRRRLRAGGNW